MSDKGKDFIRIILALFIPPIGVFLQVGFTKHFFINLILACFFYVPAMIHGVWVITKFDDADVIKREPVTLNFDDKKHD